MLVNSENNYKYFGGIVAINPSSIPRLFSFTLPNDVKFPDSEGFEERREEVGRGMRG